MNVVPNNAGVGGGTDPSVRETNPAGVELRMAVNAITPHLIATDLAPHLAPGGRVVQVGSMGQAALDLEDLNFEDGYDGITAYCRSKVALIMSTIELAARGVPVDVVHPAHEMPTRMVHESGFPITSTLDDGTLAVLRAALDSHLTDTSGVYFDRFTPAPPHEQALDPAARATVVAWMEQQMRKPPRAARSNPGPCGTRARGLDHQSLMAIEGLGAAIHPGGGVHSACGYLAARAALTDSSWWGRPARHLSLAALHRLYSQPPTIH